MSKLELHKAAHIVYAKPNEVTERHIIPTSVPTITENVKALDVTDLCEEERVQMEKIYSEYVDYYNTAISRIFNFNDWLSHTTEYPTDKIKWRTFKERNITELD